MTKTRDDSVRPGCFLVLRMMEAVSKALLSLTA